MYSDGSGYGSLSRDVRCRAAFGALAAAGLAVALASSAFAAPTLPEIRTSDRNPVPACVTPARLMAFLAGRNRALPQRFKGIADYYKLYGETWRVRWDYAFYQMAVETNFLTYRRPDGRMGDVDPKQNNFAGIGTTGGGVPGDSFVDVKTGVLAQIQHLVVYSGETIAAPVAPRTQLKQEQILLKSRELNRPVRFSDLARRWAVDPAYGGSIEWVAEGFRSEYCRGGKGQAAQPQQQQQGEVLPWATKPPAPRADAAASAPWQTATEPAMAAPQARSAPHADAPDGVATVKTRWSRPAENAVAAAPKRKDIQAEKVIAASEVEPAAPPAAQPGGKTYETASGTADGTPVPAAPASAASASEEPAQAETPFRLAFFSPPALLAQASTPAKPEFDPAAHPPSGLGLKPDRCIVEAASYGGKKAVLVRAMDGRDVHYIAVSVVDGFEKSMTDTFIRARAEGGESVGQFETRDAALQRARELCASP